MRLNTLMQHVRDFCNSTPVTILTAVLAGCLFIAGWRLPALILAAFILWDIADRICTRNARTEQASRDRPAGYDFNLLHNRIFAAVFACLVFYQSDGARLIWIPIVAFILWEIGRKFFIRNKKA